jgi:hypothetical protein
MLERVRRFSANPLLIIITSGVAALIVTYVSARYLG